MTRNRTQAHWLSIVPMWVMIAVCVLSGGCRGVLPHRAKGLVRPAVCPVCKATSIEQCCCFRTAENSGYCETNWTCLYPVSGHGPIAPPDSPHLEELPTPETLLETDVEATPGSDDAASHAPPVARVVGHWEFASGQSGQSQPARASDSHSGRSRLPVTLRLSDRSRSVAGNIHRQSQ